MTRETAEWFAGLHFIQRRRKERRAGDRFWDENLPHFLRLVRESLAVREEAATACLLIDAVR